LTGPRTARVRGYTLPTMVDLSVVYAEPSRVESDRAGGLTVALATLAPEVGGQPVFFDGWVGRPRVVAALLLSIAAVARARYFMPAAGRLLDPVLTSGDDLLRIEAFSSCCGVYARADLLGDGLREASVRTGTTNVDLNQDIRDALARIDDTTEMRLSVGSAGLRVTTRAGSAVERKVKLPVRWVKGLGEATLAQVGMRPLVEVGAVAARRLLQALPPAGSGAYSLVPAASGLRFSQAPVPEVPCIAGPYRLRELQPLARFATGLRIWARPGSGERSCAWELSVPGARIWFVLSPDVTRGFSGAGGALEPLSDPDAVAEAVALRERLDWRARLDEDELAVLTSTVPARVRSLLAVLGSQGLVGRDLAADAWYRRDLPFARELIPKLAPRLRGAATIRRDDVEAHPLPGGGYEVFVRSGDIEHRVVLDGDAARCTCRWYIRHAGARGPCRHVLAARTHLGSVS
jgi:SWIM zinc finger